MIGEMGIWTKVVTNPLGLSGFALFLVFSYLWRTSRGSQRRWLAPTAVSLAVATLVGGLALAYVEVSHVVVPPMQSDKVTSTSHQANQVQQTTTGPGSPAIQGVQ